MYKCFIECFDGGEKGFFLSCDLNVRERDCKIIRFIIKKNILL